MPRAPNNPAMHRSSRRTCISPLIVELLLIVLLALGTPQPSIPQNPANEYQVKAAFLFHFAQLVEWPTDAPSVGDQSIALCIFADETHLQDLQGTLEGKLVGTRVLHVHLLNKSTSVQSCNILFLSSDEEGRQAVILKSLQGRPVLTVGETSSFLSDGGMIRLRLDKDKVRFDINAGAADLSHIKISSQLLLLATSVTLADGSERGKPGYAH
jgi:uncharacterized protein DUF4154